MYFLYSGSLWSSLFCGVSSWWVGLDGWLVKVSWLGKLVSIFWWVELDFFSLECNEVSSNELWDVYGFEVTLGSLYLEAQGCVPLLLENLLGMSCPGTCWPLCGAWFQCQYGGVWWAPPFEDLGCFSGCLMSFAGIQKLFCGIYLAFKCSFDEFVGEKVVSPSYSSAILAPPLLFENSLVLPSETHFWSCVLVEIFL